MKVCFETFGCRLNRAEALEEEARYLAAGWELTTKHSNADRIVLRGCSVTSRAQRECEKLIHHLQRKYPSARLIVQGCLNTQQGGFGLPKAISKKQQGFDVRIPNGVEVPVPSRTARAYLKVQDGCSGKCTFCIVPKFRGQSSSVDFDEVIDKAKRFIDAGYHEIVVTGCNLSLYASQGKRLPELLSALATLGAGEIESETCRIRLGSIEPGACALEVVHVLAEHRNFCRFLHLPIQSGSNRILVAMRRSYLMKDVEQVVEEAVGKVANIGLGCDLITGFPDEKEMDFLSTKSMLERFPFSNAHIFPYSKRPGTLAAGFTGEIPREERSKRAHELAKVNDEKRSQYAKRFKGQKVEVVIEDEENQAGWTSEYFWFKRSDPKKVANPLPRKAITTFTVTDCHHSHLIG